MTQMAPTKKGRRTAPENRLRPRTLKKPREDGRRAPTPRKRAHDNVTTKESEPGNNQTVTYKSAKKQITHPTQQHGARPCLAASRVHGTAGRWSRTALPFLGLSPTTAEDGLSGNRRQEDTLSGAEGTQLLPEGERHPLT